MHHCMLMCQETDADDGAAETAKEFAELQAAHTDLQTKFDAMHTELIAARSTIASLRDQLQKVQLSISHCRFFS